MRGVKPHIILCLLLTMSASGLRAQQFAGEVVGTVSGAGHVLHGDYDDDLWGAGTFLSLHYAPLSRLNIEARFGLGELRWKISPAVIARGVSYSFLPSGV